MEPVKRDEFLALFREFTSTYFNALKSEGHIAAHEQCRKSGRRYYEDICAAADRGEDITDIVLLRLLPYADTEENRRKKAWIHVTPAISEDIKGWFQYFGWTSHHEWALLSKAILSFIRKCIMDPRQLESACQEFFDLPYTKGLRKGLITPILNAISPDNYLIMNDESWQAINFFSNSNFKNIITDYPKANTVGKEIVQKIPDDEIPQTTNGFQKSDLVNMFYHWLIQIKKYPLRNIRYWKIAPGENARLWESCRDGGYISIGWNELGDLTRLSHAEFIVMRNQLIQEKNQPGWTRKALDQVWKFANVIKEGDRIVANRGTTEILGIGKASGPYQFILNAEHGHLIPVKWEDTTKRTVNELGWRRTLIELDKHKFDRIIGISSMKERAFEPKAFELLSMLHANPKLDLYMAHKEEFETYLENPFQALTNKVADRLPKVITDFLETEKYIFSRFSKNDFGQGGAWDYYWGAFYPKGGRRVRDGQLYIWMNQDRLKIGFYIGDYGTAQKKRFSNNCDLFQEDLVRTLQDVFSRNNYYFGLGFDWADLSTLLENLGTSWQEWLKAPNEAGIKISYIFPKEEVLKSSLNTLVEKISQVHSDLFPLVLLSTFDDPIPKIRAYLETFKPTTPPHPPDPEPYTLEVCSKETGYSMKELSRWVRAIERKGQVIFYGPPGTGKTYAAEKIARHLSESSDGFMEVVQFHPAYRYDDFIQGIQSSADKNADSQHHPSQGIFLEFCRKAKERNGICVLVIDEINRANLSKVFGELLYLLEYRSQEVPLSAGGKLVVPPNIRIIGTMNSADRSFPISDNALRRRFAFIGLHPDYEILRKYHETSGFPVDKLIQVLTQVNQEIGDPHFEIGVSFFLQRDLENQIEDIWQMEIEPYLEEYFSDEPARMEHCRWDAVKKFLA